MEVKGSRDNLLAGAIFLAFGGWFAYTSSTYEVGTLLAMGPGYFPLVLGLILAALGVVIMATGLLTLRREGPVAPSPAGPHGVDAPGVDAPGVDAPSGEAGGAEAEERGSVPWVPAALLLAAIVFFGAAIGGLGLAPTLFVTVFLAALAGHGTRWLDAALIGLGLTLLSIVVFVLVLQLRIPIIGPWLGG